MGVALTTILLQGTPLLAFEESSPLRDSADQGRRRPDPRPDATRVPTPLPGFDSQPPEEIPMRLLEGIPADSRRDRFAPNRPAPERAERTAPRERKEGSDPDGTKSPRGEESLSPSARDGSGSVGRPPVELRFQDDPGSPHFLEERPVGGGPERPAALERLSPDDSLEFDPRPREGMGRGGALRPPAPDDGLMELERGRPGGSTLTLPSGPLTNPDDGNAWNPANEWYGQDGTPWK